MTRSARLLLPTLRKAIARLPGAAPNLKTVAVDLTMLPQAASNGLDAAALRPLLQALSEQQADWHWVLLTSPATHDMFAPLDALNVRRHQLAPPPPPPIAFPVPPGLLSRGLRMLTRLLGLSSRQRDWWKGLFICRLRMGLVLRAWRKLRPLLDLRSRLRDLVTDPLLTRLRVDLLFCPFGATHIRDASTPTVAIWNDLTHLRHPHALRPKERAASDHFFRETLRTADRLVCFSDQTRAEILKAARTEERRVAAIRLEPLERLPHPPQHAVAESLARFGLAAGQYVLYPASFTEFSNHKLLLVAFGMLLARRPETTLKLVCAGAANAAARQLQWAAANMDLGTNVAFVEAPTLDQQTALVQGCLGLVFPCLDGARPRHLFQGVECGKPILCGDLANLPQAVRNAALLFDHKRPAAMARVLEQLTDDPQLEKNLARRSQRQALTLGGPREVAEDLLTVFQEVLETCQPESDCVDGLYADGWTGERFVVRCAPTAEPRKLTLKLQAPHWVPRAYQYVQLLRNWRVAGKRYTVGPGQTLVVRRPVPRDGATFEFCVTPTVVPYILGIANDARRLGCLCRECTLSSPTSRVSLAPALTASI